MKKKPEIDAIIFSPPYADLNRTSSSKKRPNPTADARGRRIIGKEYSEDPYNIGNLPYFSLSNNQEGQVVNCKKRDKARGSVKIAFPEYKLVPVHLIKPNDFNPNEMPEEIYEALVEDLKLNGPGYIDPIHLRPIRGSTPFEIIDGYYRWKAVQDAGFKQIRALIHEITLDEAKAINYRKNRERGRFNPLKEAELFKSDWIKFGGKLTQQQMAKKYGVSQSYVSEVLSVFKLVDKNPEAKPLIERSIISTQHVGPILSVKDPEKRKQLILKIGCDRLSVHGTEAIAKRLAEEETSKQKQAEPKLCDLEEILTELLRSINPLKSETLDCKECEIFDQCKEAKPKILALGKILVR
jgi:ParB family chromosome partitioning protein